MANLWVSTIFLVSASFYMGVIGERKTFFMIYSPYTKTSIDCSKGNLTAATPNNNSTGQLWEVLKTKQTGYNVLRCYKSKKVMDIKGTCSKRGNYLHDYPQHGYSNQRWNFTWDMTIKSACKSPLFVKIDGDRVYAVPKDNNEDNYIFDKIPILVDT